MILYGVYELNALRQLEAMEVFCPSVCYQRVCSVAEGETGNDFVLSFSQASHM